MKTKKEVKQMISKCRKVRKGIPHFSMFGNDNWSDLDIQVNTLTACLDKSKTEIRYRFDNRVEVVGDDWGNDPEVQVYDWILGNVEDDLVTDEDIECFCKGD